MYNPNQQNYPQQPPYPQNPHAQPVYPPPSYPPQYPPQVPQGQYARQGYPPQPGMGQQQYMPRRRRFVSSFQIRLGALGFIACVAGGYMLVTGNAKNPMAALALLGGGVLVFVLVLLLPALFRR